MSDQHRDEAFQLLKDQCSHWKQRAEVAEAELKKWYGYMNQQRPELKLTLRQRIFSIFHRGRKP